MQDEFFQSLIFACVFAVIRDIWHFRGYQMVYEMFGVQHYDVLAVCLILTHAPLLQRARNSSGMGYQ